MKLFNRSLQFISISILLILGIWGLVFYASLLDEIYDSLDDGLENYKMLIIQKAQEDSTVLSKNTFNESNYSIQEITREDAFQTPDKYHDTLIFTENEQDLEPFRVLTTSFELHGKYYRLLVISSMVEEDDLIEDMWQLLIWLFLSLLVCILLVNNLVLRKLWKPFYHALGYLKNFRLENPVRFSPVRTRTKEFNDLQNAVESLTNRTLQTYQQQKQFTENASHELQTPIAIAINKLELLLEKDSFQEEDYTQISKVLESLEGIKRLNQSLLLLTRIENGQYLNNCPTAMLDITQKCIRDFEDLWQYKNLKVELQSNGNPVLNMDPALAQILVSNLLKNAILHTLPGGQISISVEPDKISIRNPGSKQALDAEKIFSRFYKASAQKSGTGLGLAIVKAISHLYRFTVQYHFDGMHVFEVHFTKI